MVDPSEYVMNPNYEKFGNFEEYGVFDDQTCLWYFWMILKVDFEFGKFGEIVDEVLGLDWVLGLDYQVLVQNMGDLAITNAPKRANACHGALVTEQSFVLNAKVWKCTPWSMGSRWPPVRPVLKDFNKFNISWATEIQMWLILLHLK